MVIKNALKFAGGCASAASLCVRAPGASHRACVFNYHRVSELGCTDLTTDSWNVSPQRFERHARWLAKEAECVPLKRLMERIQSKPGNKPLVALTFDDGFANFRRNVLPALERYRIPATIFVVTKYVGSMDPYPFDGWGRRNRGRANDLSWRPVNWLELEECLKSGWVAVGSHSYSHPHGRECTDEKLLEETLRSRDTLREHFGTENAVLYSYPYGSSRHGDVRPAYVEAVRAAGYRVAVTTNLGLVDPESDALTLPRVEATGYDLAASLKAKAMGCLGPSRLLDRVRQARAGGRNAAN